MRKGAIKMRKGAISSSGAATYGSLTRFYGSLSRPRTGLAMRKGAINLWLPYAPNALTLFRGPGPVWQCVREP